jgi:hypothetical protein
LVATFVSSLPPDQIQASIFDLNGRKQATLRVTGTLPVFEVRWDGVSQSGRSLPAGIYVLEIKAGGSSRRSAVVLAR